MKQFTRKIIASGGVLIVALMFSNFLNFVFNAYLGRMLSFEEFGLITLLNSFGYITAIFLNALAITVNHRVSFLSGQSGKRHGISFAQSIFRRSLFISLIFSILWIIAVPYLSGFFHELNLFPLLLFTPVFSFGVLAAIQKGALQGNFYFSAVGLILIAESIVKLGLAILFTSLHLSSYVYLSFPISILVSYCAATILVSKKFGTILTNKTSKGYHFPRQFFAASIVTGIASTLFLTLDVILVKHFLSPVLAGEYALLSLVGKMVYFFGSLPNVFIISFTARDEGKGANPNRTFYKLFTVIFIFTAIAFLSLGLMSSLTVPFLFGEKTFAILPFVLPYTLAISLFTLTSAIVTYHLARRQYLFSFLQTVISFALFLGIIQNHTNIYQITQTILAVSTIGFCILVFSHFIQRNGEFVFRNLVDLIDIFFPLPKVASIPGKKKILIFNWRDTKHKYAGGAEVYIYELAKRWVADGHQVTLFCGNDSKCSRNEVIDGIQIIRRGGFYFVYFWAFVYYLTKFRGKYDVIIDCENGIPFFTPLFASEKKFLLIHHVHQEVFLKSLMPPFSLLASFLETKVMPFIYQDIETITVSPSSKDAILEYKLTKKEPEIIYNGVDLAKFKPGKKSKNPLIIYLGRLKYYKSLNILIHAANKVLKEISEVDFVIAGEGEEKRGLQQLTQKLDLKDKFKFLGKVTEEEKIKLYQKAWVFVNPSFIEGFGLTSIEANACGTPVVASRVVGLRDSVNNPHTGFLVPHADVKAFTDKILLLIKDKKLREKMSQESIQWAKRFEWQTSAKKFLILLDNTSN